MTPLDQEALAAEDGRIVRARQRREMRHEQLLASARRVFANRGYHATTIQELLDDAQVARGTFYAHFATKQAAFEAVLNAFVEEVEEALVPVDIHASEPSHDQLLGNLTRALEILSGDQDLSRLLFHQAPGVSEELRVMMTAFYGRVTALIERSIRTGIRLGIVRDGDVSLRARLALGAIKEAASQNLEREEPLPISSLARTVLEFALRGLLLTR